MKNADMEMGQMMASKSHRVRISNGLMVWDVEKIEIARGGNKRQYIQKLMIPTRECFHSDSSSS